MKYLHSSFCEAGPRSTNEDSIGVWEFPGGIAVAIADGLGALGGGDVASRLAIEIFGREFADEPLRKVAADIHEKIVEQQGARSDRRRMATTLTGFVLRGRHLKGVHCGDTRAVVARGNGIRRLTSEQTEAQRLFDAGKLNKEEFRNYPRRNILDSALGAAEVPKIREFEFEIEAGDQLFVTSDGVHEKVLLREMKAIAVQCDNPAQFAARVMSAVREKSPDDNFSLVAVFVEN